MTEAVLGWGSAAIAARHTFQAEEPLEEQMYIVLARSLSSGVEAFVQDLLRDMSLDNARHDKLIFGHCEVDTAKTTEELEDSKGFLQLDIKLARELDKIISGEFKRFVQVVEISLSEQSKMFKHVRTCPSASK